MKQFEMFTYTLRGAEPKDDWVNVDLEGVFREGEKETRVKGFYAGNGEYQVRYLPRYIGTCSFEIHGNIPLEETGEMGEILLSQKEDVLENPGRHGVVKAVETHFEHEDGTVFLPFGTTVYAMIHQEKELLAQTLATLKDAPFNKIRFCVFPKDFCFNKNEPELFAFEKQGEKWNVKKPCMAFWEQLDQVMDELYQMDIEADLILFHPYDKWGFMYLNGQERLTYLSYLVRRLSAYPNLWWSLANEYDQMDGMEKKDWYQMSEFLAKEDAFSHLISNHNFVTPWDFADPFTTHVCLQDSDAAEIPLLLKKYGKPVMYDEMGYEGNIPYNWGNLSAFEMVNRFWKTMTMGGYATHGETYMEEMNDDQVLWWSKGGVLKGESAKRIAFLRELLEELPGLMTLYESENGMKLESQEQLQQLIDQGIPGISDNLVMKCMAKMNDDEFKHMQKFMRQPIIHCGDEAFLTYYGDMCTIYGELELPENKTYRLEVIDVWEMTRTVVSSGVSGKAEAALPGKPGIALLAVAEN